MTSEKFDFLITGASGFIGSHLLERLVDRGSVAVVVYEKDRSLLEGYKPPSGKHDTVVIEGDLTDRDWVNSLPEARFVYHLAAISFVPPTIKRPELALNVNLGATFNMLERYRSSELEMFVFMSSSQVYGIPRQLPMSENHPMEPTNPYGATKLAADRLVQSYHICYGMPTVIFRPFNIFGPRQDIHFVIPTMITQSLKGGIITLGDLRPERDFTYITDAVELLLSPISYPNCPGTVCNIGSGRGVSIGDLVKMINGITGNEEDVVSDPARFRKGEIPEVVADCSRAREIFGWEARITLENGLASTVDFYRGLEIS